MEHLLGFGDNVGSSDLPLKIPHVAPQTPEHHSLNMAEIERQVNRIKTGMGHLYTTDTPITLLGDNTPKNVHTVRFPAGRSRVEISTFMHGATSDMTSISINPDPTPASVKSFASSDSSYYVAGSPSRLFYKSYSCFVLNYPRMENVTFTYSGTTDDGDDITLDYMIITTPLITYLPRQS